MMHSETLLTRGQLAQQGGVNPETIRYYERCGLLPQPERSAANYRLFTPDTVQRVRFIKRAQAGGFSLEEIGEMLSWQHAPDATCGPIRTLAQGKLREIEARIADLQAMQRALVALAAECPGESDSVDACPILKHFEG